VVGSSIFGAHEENGRRRSLELVFERATNADMQLDFSLRLRL
jgi:hypothetical protein